MNICYMIPFSRLQPFRALSEWQDKILLADDNYSGEAFYEDINHGLSVMTEQHGSADLVDDAGNPLPKPTTLSVLGSVPWARTFSPIPPAEGNDIAETTVTTRDGNDGNKGASTGNDR